MTSSSRQTLQTIVVCGLLAIVAAALFRYLERPRTTVPDDFHLTELDVVPLANEAQPLKPADLKGKVVLVNFWGTWCPPCLAEWPHIEALSKQYRSRDDFMVLSISATGRMPEDITGLRDSTQGYLSLAGHTTPVYADPVGKTRRGLGPAVDTDVYPASVLIDREGKVVGAWTGFNKDSFEEIALQVAAMMKK